MDKKSLSETDICAKFITPALVAAGWDEVVQIRREVGYTNGRIVVRGKMVSQGKSKRADYVLYHKPNLPLAVIEGQDANHGMGEGIQQALGYALDLDVPFVFASNGDGFRFQDRTLLEPGIVRPTLRFGLIFHDSNLPDSSLRQEGDTPVLRVTSNAVLRNSILAPIPIAPASGPTAA